MNGDVTYTIGSNSECGVMWGAILDLKVIYAKVYKVDRMDVNYLTLLIKM